MKNVYLWMTAGLFLTGIVAHGAAVNGLYPRGMSMWGLIIAEVLLVGYLARRIMTMPPMTAVLVFALYAAVNGLTLSYVFLVYTGSLISNAFFVTAAVFGFMSFIGMTTKRDLTSMSTYLMMGLMGVLIASLINMFMRSSGMAFLISIGAVIVFTGLTAYDTQKILAMSRQYSRGAGEENFIRLSILGALTLYLDFINLFLHLLRLLSLSSRD